MKFKKGDSVVCIKKNIYTITDYGIPCIFCGYELDGKYMYVRTEYSDTVFRVASVHFKLMKGNKSLKII